MKILKIWLLLLVCSLAESKSLMKISDVKRRKSVDKEQTKLALSKSKFPKKYLPKQERPLAMFTSAKHIQLPTFPFRIDTPIVIEYHRNHLSSLHPHFEHLPVFPVTKYMPKTVSFTKAARIAKKSRTQTPTHAVHQPKVDSPDDDLLKKEEKNSELSEKPQADDSTMSAGHHRRRIGSLYAKSLHGFGNLHGEMGHLGNARKDDSYLSTFLAK